MLPGRGGVDKLDTANALLLDQEAGLLDDFVVGEPIAIDVDALVGPAEVAVEAVLGADAGDIERRNRLYATLENRLLALNGFPLDCMIELASASELG